MKGGLIKAYDKTDSEETRFKYAKQKDTYTATKRGIL